MTPETIDASVAPPPAVRENSARIVWALAWPAVALNSLQVVNTLLDRTFVGHLPSAALTAVGGSMNVMFLLFTLAMCIGTATTAIVSRAYGAGNKSEVREATRQAIGLALSSGVIMAIVGALATPYVAQALLPSGAVEAKRLMGQYLSLYAIGLPATFLIQTLAGSMRGAGDTKSPMYISGIQILIHIVLNIALIPAGTTLTCPAFLRGIMPQSLQTLYLPGADWGLAGAGVALSTSAVISALIYWFWTRRTDLGESLALQLPSRAWAKRILNLALPNAGNGLLRVGSLAAFTYILRFIPNGATAIGAMSIAFSIEAIMFMPAFGLSIAASALVGQSLGMGKPARAERLTWVAGHHSALVILALCAPLFLIAPIIAGFMAKDADIARAATELIRWLCVTEVAFGYSMVMIGALQGAGETRGPVWLSVVSLWIVRVPLAAVLALGFKLGAPGAWAAMSISQLLQGVLSIMVFRRGTWKVTRV